MAIQVFFCPGCNKWQPLVDATEVEAAFYAPLIPQNVNPQNIAELYQSEVKYRRRFQPILLCLACLPVSPYV